MFHVKHYISHLISIKTVSQVISSRTTITITPITKSLLNTPIFAMFHVKH